MGHPDKQRRRGSAGVTTRRAVSERKLDGLQTQTRRRSTGFDPFDVSNAESVNATLDKKSSGGSSRNLGINVDPYSKEALEKVMQKKKERGAPRVRRAPQRSASVGTLPVSMSDFVGPEEPEAGEQKDDDLMFDKIDWDNAGTPIVSKGKSRRHSMDSSRTQTSQDKDEFGDGAHGEFDFDDPFGNSVTKEGSKPAEDDEKKKEKKKSGKSRRQSLDSALSKHSDEEVDGFGPVTTYGFGGDQSVSVSVSSSGSDRRKGMTRAKSGSGDSMSIASWKSAESEPSKGSSSKPGRVLHRRRSETSMRRNNSSKIVMEYDTETTATADSSLDSPGQP